MRQTKRSDDLIYTNMKKFVIIAGANGTGKTTLAKEFLKKFKIEFLNADEIAISISRNKKSLLANRIKAGKRFIFKLDDAIKARKSVAIESTLAGKYLLKTIKNVKKSGYRISIIYVFVDNPEIALRRIQARVDAGGHDVPKDDVLRRFYRSRDNFWKLYKNVADEWTMFYNGIERPVFVASGVKAGVEIMDSQLFDLFKRIKK